MTDVIQITISKGHVVTVDAVDADLGVFKWTAVTDPCGVIYAQRMIYKPVRKVYLMHRIIMSRKLGRKLNPGEEVNHLNENRLDNRRCNLRLASHAENTRYMNMRSDNTSGFKGATKSAQGWRACIRVNGKTLHLGYFDDVLEAHKAYCLAAVYYFGKFANFGETSPFKTSDFDSVDLPEK